MTQPPQPSWTPPPGAPAGLRPRRSAPPPAPRADRPGRRRPLRRLLTVVAVLVLVLAAALGVYGLHLARTFDAHRATAEVGGLSDPGDGAVNILLLGTDSREGESAADAGERSDTMMLVHVPADRSGVQVISVLRDSFVDIPGHGRDKVNAALQIGGYPLVVQTVEQLLGVPVHHVVELDFQGFRGVTNALGGVEVCNPQAFSSGQVAPSYYPRGRILLQDTAALRYVRERHAFGDGDVTRVENQQRYVLGALERFTNPLILLDPARTTEVVATLAEHLAVDPGLDSGALAALAWQLRGVRGDDVETSTVPVAGFGADPQGQSIVRLDEAAMADLRRALQEDDVATYLRQHEDGGSSSSAGPAPGRPGVEVLPLLARTAAMPAGGPCDG